MKKFITFIVTCIMITITSAGHAKQNVWTESFAQGTTEYFIESGNHWLLISCTDKDDEDAGYSSVTIYNTKIGKSLKTGNVVVDGHTFTLPVKADSRMGTNNLLVLLDSLRSSDVIANFNGISILFKKNTSNKIIPYFGNDFTCKVF